MRMFMTEVVSEVSALSLSFEVFWKGMLAIAVVVGICMAVTALMSKLDRAAEERKKANEQNSEQ